MTSRPLACRPVTAGARHRLAAAAGSLALAVVGVLGAASPGFGTPPASAPPGAAGAGAVGAAAAGRGVAGQAVVGRGAVGRAVVGRGVVGRAVVGRGAVGPGATGALDLGGPLDDGHPGPAAREARGTQVPAGPASRDGSGSTRPARSAGGSARSLPSPPARSGAGRRVVFSESRQRVWLVGTGGAVRRSYLVSGSRYDNLLPGSYRVFSRSARAWSFDGSGTMRWFVRFAHGRTAAIGFHDIPVGPAGPVQAPAQLGTPQSHGCIRQHPRDARALWRFAPLGTRVVVTP